MEQYMDDYESYKRYSQLRNCKCGCPAHCNHSCLDCDACSDCECEQCLTGQGQN